MAGALVRAERRAARRALPSGEARADTRGRALPVARAIVGANRPAAVGTAVALGATALAGGDASTTAVGVAALVGAAVGLPATLAHPAADTLALVGGDARACGTQYPSA